MTVPFNDLASTIIPVRHEIDAAIARVLNRGWFIHGPEDEAFEAQFAQYVGVSNAIGVANGTDAIQLALLALGVGLGDEVICPALTAAPTALAILATGAEPVFCDVDGETLTIDPTKLESCITKKTRAIIPVHIYGLAANMPAILEIARAHEIAVVEDCAQSHGARVGRGTAGSFTEVAAFSFYPTKNLGAYGDGGAVATNNTDLALKVRQFANLGQTGRFEHSLKGINSRLDEIQAAILQVLLSHLEFNIERRRQIAGWYNELLGSIPGVSIPVEPSNFRHVYHLYVIRHPKRDQLKRHLADRGIGTDVHYPRAMSNQPVFAQFRNGPAGIAETAKAVNEILSLPIYPTLTHQQVDAVCGAIRDFEY